VLIYAVVAQEIVRVVRIRFGVGLCSRNREGGAVLFWRGTVIVCAVMPNVLKPLHKFDQPVWD
jgi:hypothetical protein